jgi:flagellar hook-length control protein FliK
MAAMVKQTLSQMLQAAPTPAMGMGARSADGAAASDTSFSNTLERKMSEPERPRESTAASSQNTQKTKENQPVQDKAPEPKAADRNDSAQNAAPAEPAREPKEAKPADKDAAKADAPTDPAKATDAQDAGSAQAADAAAATATPDTVAATPAVLAATPANDAATAKAANAAAQAVTQTGVAQDKTQKAADVIASNATDAAKPGRGDAGAKGNDTRADLNGSQARAAELDAAQSGKASVVRDNVTSFAAQLENRMGTPAKTTDTLAPLPGTTNAGNGINPALAGNLPSQAAAAATAARPVLPTHLATPVDSADWPDAVGNRVVWMSGRDESRAELILTPPHLGKLEISLTVTGDTTTAHFTAANPAAREALEQAMPRLREMLEQAGVTLAESNVNTAPQDQPGERGNGRHFAGGRGTASGEMIIDNVGTSAGRWIARGEGMIDTFA